MVYPQQTWSVVGEQQFDGSYTLLNPAIKVSQVVLQANNIVSLSLSVTENGGVFQHYAHITYDNVDEQTDIDILVNDAMNSAFPAASVSPPLADLI